MQSRKKKKIKLFLIIGIVVIVFGVLVTILAFLHEKNSKVEVVPVENISMTDGEMGVMDSTGTVTSESSQVVKVDEDKVITQVFVEKGQKVKAGDKLLTFDVKSVEISLEREKLVRSNLDDKYAIAQNKLEKLKNTKPVTINYIAHENYNENPTKNASNAYVASKTSSSRTVESEDDTSNTDDTSEADSPDDIDVDDANSQDAEDDKNSIDSENPMENNQVMPRIHEEQAEQDVQEGLENEENESESDGYTAQELRKAILDCEQELKEIEIDKRKSDLKLKELQEEITDGTVVAKFDGVVKQVGDVNNPSKDGEDFLVLSGEKGVYVAGEISELKLKNIKVGQNVIVSQEENSGEIYEAKITEISSYPETSSDGYGDGNGNPNVSLYRFKAYIKKPKNLKAGDMLNISMESSSDIENESFYIDQAYIRNEGSKFYVYVSKNGRLKKQYVKIGKISMGMGTEIKSGLTKQDYVAFPYGKKAKEGIKTKKTEG